jgi:hypothetical protein
MRLLAAHPHSVRGHRLPLWRCHQDSAISGAVGKLQIRISISAGGRYSVTVGNGTCSIKLPSVTETILYPPSVPTAILGLDSLCAGSDSVLYSVASVAGATSYNWNVPSGWTIKSGAGTSAVFISVDSTAGSISVNAQNTCGTSNSISKSIGLDSAPHLTGTISGADTVCLGSADRDIHSQGVQMGYCSGVCRLHIISARG